MVKKYDAEFVEYFNEIQLVRLFLLTELHEFFIFIGAYDQTTDRYNPRRVIWSLTGITCMLSFVGLVALTCLLYVANFITRFI